MGQALALTALTLRSNRTLWILFAVLTRLPHGPIFIDNTKQINHGFFKRFPQTHSNDPLQALWQAIACRAINDTQSFRMSDWINPTLKEWTKFTDQIFMHLTQGKPLEYK